MIPSAASSRFAILLFFALLALSGAMLFYHLGAEPFQDYDEATYAEVTSESLSRGDFLSLTFLTHPYFRKPPLMFWMTGAAEKVLPDTEFAMRLPSALAALLLIPLAFLICVEAGAGLGAGITAALIMATTSAAMEPGRQARFDVLIAFFILAALYAGMRAQRLPRWYLFMGIAIGCAVLTKSVIAVFAPIALLIYLLQRKGWAFLKEGWFWGGVATFAIITAPWHLYETLKFGTAFWHIYLGTQVIDRAGTNLFEGISSNLTTNLDYLGYYLRFGAPWSGLFLLSLLPMPFLWKRMERQPRIAWATCTGTVAAIALVMGWSQTKAVTYLIPLYPFMAVALALAARELWLQGREEVRTLVVTAVAVLGVFGAAYTVWNVHHLNPYYGVQYQLAREEYAIAKEITERDSDPLLYTYKNDNLGSLQYYTRLPFTKNQFVYTLENAPTAIPPAFVVTTVSQSELEKDFPRFTFEPIYTGSLLSAFTVTS
jgi:4-amino-4-deoxy-L-arabinose transferase-like glycosyltransferase